MPTQENKETTKPLLVTKTRSRQIIGVGPTKHWQLCRDGVIETVRVGKVELVVYASLERLAAGGGA